MTHQRRSKHPVGEFKQGGWTFWSLAFVMSVLLFFAYVGMRLVPVYAVNENIKNAMEVALQNVDLKRTSRAELIRRMDDQLYLDGSHKVLNYKTDLKLSRSKREFIVETKYSSEVPLFLNLSLLARFHNTSKRALDTGS